MMDPADPRLLKLKGLVVDYVKEVYDSRRGLINYDQENWMPMPG